jgi:hypothetical protein
MIWLLRERHLRILAGEYSMFSSIAASSNADYVA